MKRFFLYKNYPAFHHKNSTIIFDYKKNNFIKVPLNKLKDGELKKFIDLDFAPTHKKFNPKNPALTLILNRDCNMRCLYCSVYGGKYKQVMSPDIALQSVKNIISNKPKRFFLTFFGGEPTLKIDIIKDTVNYLKKEYKGKLELAISTNGIIDKEITAYLIENKFVINLSMDGLPKIQNFQRPLIGGNSSSDIAEKTLKTFVKNKTLFKVRSTVTNYSVDKMIDSLKYFLSLGVKVVHFEPLNVCGRAKDTNISNPNIKEYVKNYKKCIDIAIKNKASIVNGLYNNILMPSCDYCEAVSGAKIVITPEGYISRCYEVQDKNSSYFNDFIVGKITNKGFKINSKKVEKLESVLKIKRGKCKRCFARFICSGGCPLRSNHYRCNIARELIADAIIRSYEA